MDRSLGELFSDLSQQTAELIRHELRLAKAELGEKAAAAGRHATLIGAGLGFALAAVIAAAAAAALLLIEAGLQPWAAAAITAAAMGLVAFALAQTGLSALKRSPMAPVETMRSLKETTQWLKNETR